MSEPIALNIHEKRPGAMFPDLKNLLDGWFHQDFDIEGPDLETILPKYVATSWLVDVQGTIDDIGRVIALYGKDDATLREAVERIFEPQVILEGWDGMTTREWLLRVADLLEVGLRARKAESQRDD